MSPRASVEGYTALDIPTHAALAYVRQHASGAPTPASADAHTDTHAQRASHVEQTLLVVDAACELPAAWLHHHKIVVIPLAIRFGDTQMLDVRDDAESAAFAQMLVRQRKATVESESLSPAQIRDYMQTRMAPDVSQVLQISFASSFNRSHMHSLRATQSLVLIHNKVRRSIGSRTALKAWVLDSKTGLTGTAVLLFYASQLRSHGVAAADIVAAMDRLRDQVHTLLVPGDIGYLSASMMRRSRDSLARLKLRLAKWLNVFPVLYAGASDVRPVARIRYHDAALDHALARVTRHIELGVTAPIVCLSFAGDLDVLHQRAAFVALRVACRVQRAELTTTVMSMTGSTLLGPGALAVSFASARFLE